mmetsp:Transcript_36548/g.63414  ORF Transcript_36548/g.63414 Transcript_36548/m.63414 type:complete len:311 (+) Transcript_36548:120-1052(+)|eukprot:CAMPEP_0206371530 /NCGR_PEP_ID=MMETSP0294-20121207/6534_1 /ASSEMBLY_ACC=CAM_ASM_000327 /TAXON_ID=39354 /ORGANISM="Heterosigma akashiwo, Strain CCMP2393" /LENGTH=310 /DNA_ID=CAMNT_0053818667 /DNA_START=58 /DNA_END=990 /DNA_ORIENTATION=-
MNDPAFHQNAVAQAKRMQRDIVNTLEIAAPGGKPTRVMKAPVAEYPESKRQHTIERQEEDLDNQMVVLDEGTRRRNREFYEKLDALDSRGRRWTAKLVAETKERDEAHAAVLEQFKSSLKASFDEMMDKLDEALKPFEDEKIPEQDGRTTGDENAFEQFVNVTVPNVIEEQSGVVTRKLQKAHDNFDIDNAKILKREKKLLKKRDDHFDDTYQRFEDETSTRIGKLRLLAEDIHNSDQIDTKQFEKLVPVVFAEIKDTKERIREMTQIRQDMDCLVLENLADTQKRCQHSVLQHFGEKAGEYDSETEGGG